MFEFTLVQAVVLGLVMLVGVLGLIWVSLQYVPAPMVERWTQGKTSDKVRK